MEYVIRESKSQIRQTESYNEELEDMTYRRISQTDRDLAPMKQDKMIDVALWLYKRNVLARRIIDITVSHVLAGGINYTVENEDVKKVLDKFWYDSVNNWDMKQDTRVKDQCLTGELILKTFVRKYDGLVRVASVDPKLIEEVISNPDNIEDIEYIKFKNEEKKYKVIKNNDYTNKLEGEVFYFPINKVSYQKRGESDLLALSDWCDMYDKTMWTVAERIPLLFSFVWDISIEGADVNQLKKKYNDLNMNPPQPGSFRIHNEKEKWEAVQPSLNAGDIKEFMKMLKSQPISGSGFPFHWFGEGEDANRASALAMNDPVLKQLKNRQKYVKYMFEMMFDFQIQCSKTAGYIPENIDDTYQIYIPEPSKKDIQMTSDVISKVSNSLMTATTNNWISKDKATEIIAMLYTDLGVEVNKDEEVEATELQGIDVDILNNIAEKMKANKTV